MEPNFSGFVIDPAKCSKLSLEEKRELVHEISQWAENAPEILQSWSRRELLQLICAELGQDKKYTGVTKPKMIAHLLTLVSSKNTKKGDIEAGCSSVSSKNQDTIKKKRKKEHTLQFAIDAEADGTRNSRGQIDSVICENLACRATMSPGDKYCRRCSCCICYDFDDNKDPSLWLFCSSDLPYPGDSCGMSCHLKCALKNEKAGILKNGCYTRLDGSFYCVCCGKVNWLIGIWRKQLLIARDARRVDVLCDRLSLSHKILKGTERYVELHSIVNEAIKKLKKEVGPPDKVSAMMARGIVNRLACGAEVQKLCASAVEEADSLLSRTFDLLADIADLKTPGATCPQAFRIHFEDLSPTSVVVSLQSRDGLFKETIIGCSLWYRSSSAKDYTVEPSSIVLRPDTKVKISGLAPGTEYHFKASPFSSAKDLGIWEARCVTRNRSLLSNVQEAAGEQPTAAEAVSQRGSTNSVDNNHQLPKLEFGQGPLEAAPMETPTKPSWAVDTCTPDSGNKKGTMTERQYEYCVKVIRWLECEGYMEKEFRVKFLTWFSLKATPQERRVVSAFIDVLIDEPDSLVAQLADAFMDGICNKKPAVRRGFCTRLWY
ncbi:VIN3-like protein 2 [Iris pallida]|uniref:VIN3-like protein 2 n=1 Tax=Iris pallida TaxID=29817 RepID=A0AAX6EJG7_IRIPA|nr:VIN3-like protein 2 [Iris pallida]